MSRTVSMLVFVAVALTVLGFAHYYLWARLVRAAALPTPWQATATGLICLLGLSLPLGFFFGHAASSSTRYVTITAYVWMGFVLILVALLAGTDLLRLAVLGAQALASAGPGTADPLKRLLVGRVLAGTVALGALGLGVYGLSSARSDPDVRRVPVTLSRLPLGLDGTTIVQLSDLHLGPELGSAWLGRIVERVNELHPDLVVITGDLVDAPVSALAGVVDRLSLLRTRYGVYFVTGNHEYYAGVEPWVAELRRLGVVVLRNQRVTIGEGEDSFELAGVDDVSARRFSGEPGADLARALAALDPTRESILLSHQPVILDQAAAAKVGLVLSGHTHGGQLWPWTLLVRLVQPVVRGHAERGATQIYVSQGTGFWGPPMRIGTQSEITQIELHAPATAEAGSRDRAASPPGKS